jgi:hypothetical protein
MEGQAEDGRYGPTALLTVGVLFSKFSPEGEGGSEQDSATEGFLLLRLKR